MARKQLLKTPSGSATIFGGEDIDYINQLLSGADQTSADPVVVKTIWKYRSSKLQIANPANTFNYNIAGQAITADKTLTIPVLGGDRSFVFANTAQTLTNKTIVRSPTASDTNLFPDAQVMPNIGKRKTAIFSGSVSTQVSGFANGAISVVNATLSHTNATTGRYSTFSTTTTSGSQSGQRSNEIRAAVARCVRPRYVTKFRFTAVNAMRYFAGLVATSSAFVTGTGPLDGPLEGYMLCYRSDGVDTTWKIAHNDNSGTTVFDDTTVTVAANTTYIVELKAPSSNDKFQWSINNGTTTVTGETTTDIPASTSLIYPQQVIETLAASDVKSNNLYYWLLETVD